VTKIKNVKKTLKNVTHSNN